MNSLVQPPAQEPIAYSPSQAAAALSIGRTALFALIREGRLPAKKLGSRTLIRRADLIRLVDELACVEAPDAPSEK